MVLQIVILLKITLDVVFLHESCESQLSVTFVVEKAGESFNVDLIPNRGKKNR